MSKGHRGRSTIHRHPGALASWEGRGLQPQDVISPDWGEDLGDTFSILLWGWGVALTATLETCKRKSGGVHLASKYNAWTGVWVA